MSLFNRIRFIIIIICFLALLAVPAVRAQAPVAGLAITYLEAAAAPDGTVRVSALVSVVDETGQPVTGLSAQDFTVSENGTALPPGRLAIAPATRPLTVTLLLDTSKPMARPAPDGVRAIDSAKDAAIQFIEGLGGDDGLAVYSYNSGLSLAADYTYDHNLAIDRGVVPLDASEAETACLYDALQQILEGLSGRPSGPHLVIVITGSQAAAGAPACGGGASLDGVLQAATVAGSQVPVYSIGFGKNVNADDLALLARLTGGRSLLAPDSRTLTNLLATISGQLRGQYELSYTTQAPAGLAKISVQENGSRLSDSRQVFIPAATPPTPTPPPQFALDPSIQVIDGGQRLQVNVGAPGDVTLARTTLYVDGRLAGQNTAPPFDQFVVNLADVGAGKHSLRVEAAANTGVVASAEREVDVTLPPTPVPTPTPLPVPTPTPVPSPGLLAGGPIPSTALLLVIAGLVLLLVLVLVMGVYFMMSSRRRPAPVPVMAPPVEPPEIPAMITMIGAERDNERTFDPGDSATSGLKARLVVQEGRPAVAQPSFELSKPELKLGRNTAREKANDIDIQDREVSRSHARIIFQNGGYFIQDLGSSTGTSINGQKIAPFRDVSLPNGAEVGVGPHIKFRFEMIGAPAGDHTRFDGGLDDAATHDDDSFMTQIQ